MARAVLVQEVLEAAEGMDGGLQYRAVEVAGDDPAGTSSGNGHSLIDEAEPISLLICLRVVEGGLRQARFCTQGLGAASSRFPTPNRLVGQLGRVGSVRGVEHRRLWLSVSRYAQILASSDAEDIFHPFPVSVRLCRCLPSPPMGWPSSATNALLAAPRTFTPHPLLNFGYQNVCRPSCTDYWRR
jgi:hypothetical protein